MTVTEQDLNRVAALANLELTIEEKPAIIRDLNSLLSYFGQLNELDTSAVPPMLQASENDQSSGTGFREDMVVPSLDREQVLVCAPDTDHIFFRVPKVIER